jgi:superfamily II DNA/RNA helicase
VKGIEHGCFHGGMEQNDREQALIKFRNGTNQLILATDLAARGLDIPEISFIIHYHLPNRPEEFTHRNGRTARMSREGTAYVLSYSQEKLPDFIGDIETEKLDIKAIPFNSVWSTLFLSGGRRDKISKGDILGFLIKEGEVDKASIGQIELKQDCAFVAVHKSDVKKLIEKLNNTKLKKRKLRIYVL